MGFWRSLWRGDDLMVDAAPTFAVDADAIDPAVFGLVSYADPVAPAPRIDRRAAMQVPAVKRCRDLIAGSLGSLPLDVYGPDRQPTRMALFDQPEASIPRTVTMTRTVEDMLFEGVAWWRVAEVGWHGFPVKVERLAKGRVTVDEQSKKVYVDGKEAADSDLIRLDSPNDPLLVAGARAIRTCLHLDAAAQRHAEGAPPLDFFTPAEGADPAEDADILALLDSWRTARQSRSTAYVPAALQYHSAGWSPEQLQMSEARQHAVLEIARVAGVDAEDLGVSTTSRTYANQFDRRKAFLDFTLGGYLSALQDRLSMGDVTPRGYFARVNLDAFLRSDTLTRFETYEVGLRVGALTVAEVRELEDRPPTSTVVAPVAADNVRSVASFEAPAVVPLDATTDTTFTVDRESRTITGLAVPFGKPAMSRGALYQFSRGTLTFSDPSRVKLLRQHDFGRAVGYAAQLEETDAGMVASFKVARGAEGDEALSLAEDKVLDGLSIGLGVGGKFETRAGVRHAVSAPLAEISLTPCPAFDDARVLSVAASATEGATMSDEITTTEAEAPDFSAVTDAIRAGFEGLALPQRETVSAAGGPVEVTEQPVYRFDGAPARHCFTEDLRAANFGDSAARQRVEEFMAEAFAVTSGNVGSLNPTQNRPELYVPNLAFTRPLWELVSNGTVDDKTPFTVPKFATGTGLVGNHTEGVEPTPGAFTATSQTITPAPMSGKIEINREVLDQGGSPQADQIIWGEMLNAWFEAVEAKIAAALATTATAELQLTSAVDAALVAAMTNYFAGLQFVRGGNRFTAFAADAKLFPALVAAKDTAGRPLLPVLAPSNAQGTTEGGFDRVQVGNQTVRAAWALSQGTNTRSYNFVPSSVWCWASAPKRFQFEYQVKSIDLAIWGYAATAILRDSDVKPIDYDVSDA